MNVTDTDRAAIRLVVETQLQAFHNDDAVTAFSFATPGIQETFKTPEDFMEMVKTYYQAVYRPRSILFDDLALVNGALAQPVLLLDYNDIPIRALYQMEKQSDGSWKINGCYLIPIDSQTA